MEIALGIGVGSIALVLLVLIVIGPSRRVRAESKMPLETQVRLLLGLSEETGQLPVVRAADSGPTPFDTAQFTALANLAAPNADAEQSSGAA